MVLSKHVNVEELEGKLLKSAPKTPLSRHEQYIDKYSSNTSIPKYSIGHSSCNDDLIYKHITQELSLDGTPTLNLASFVTTEIDDIPLKLISENIVKNLADNDEYPTLTELQNRCVSILSNLWHAPYHEIDGYKVTHSVGTPTTGSSEAIMLAGLALKKRWQAEQKKKGKSIDKPNILMATCAQVALEKFARYFDVENRLIPISEGSSHLGDISKIKENIDENTIGIFVILGSTFTGSYENVEKVSQLLDEVEKEKGINVRIHVDGASGGFVTPFAQPHLKWDFEIPRVDSINTSGHKYGLTTAGLGWVIWKDEKALPEELKFSLDYLGGSEETFGLNFSRPGFPVIHQYFNFLTYAREGYTKLFTGCLHNARLLSNFLDDSTYFKVVSVIHKPIENTKEVYKRSDESIPYTEAEKFQPGLPVVAWRFSDELIEKYPEIPQSIFSFFLRKKGYIIPNYHLPPDEHEKEILRVVVRPSLGLNLLDKLMKDIIIGIELLIGACENARSLVKGHETEEGQDSVYKLLLSVAADGLDDLEEIRKQQVSLKKKGAPLHRSTC